jgi:crotonobetainyl-CoA:carnitine CoA-transferase CaiB-like acyl-CoA transferase
VNRFSKNKENHMQERPLEGIRVLECGVYHAGPGGPAILGDLGAEVIKIEQPGAGDPIRQSKKIGSIDFAIPGDRSLFCEGANRNKKSVTLDVKSEQGQKVLERLVRKTDVFLTNVRAPAIERMKIGYPRLREINPKLIYASVSAFGAKGPDKDHGGFDYQGQARSGLMYAMGEIGMPPMVSQFGIIDQATAIQISHQIITALFMRERTGIGQEVHVSILGTAMYLSYFNVLIASMGGIEVPRHRRTTENPMRNYYQCGDGRWLMMTLTPPTRHWGPLCRALGRPALEHDPRYDTDDKRSERAGELVKQFDEIFATRPRDEWLKIFGEHDLFCCAVNSLMELTDDPQVLANDYLVDFEHPTAGTVKIPGYPGTFSESWARTTGAAPELGEHTEEVLTGLCGYSTEEFRRFKGQGVV